MKHFCQFIFIGCIGALLAGCSSTPSRFYTLAPAATGDGTSQANYAVVVGPVAIPAEVDRPQMTLQLTRNEVKVDEFNRWAEPLNAGITRVVAADLAALLGTPRVAAAPLANFKPDWRVTIDVQKFISERGKAVRIDALWVVAKPDGSVSFSGHTVAGEPVADDSYDALAAAHSRALAKVSSDIAAAMRVEAQKSETKNLAP
jgi:uncharacterized lipoprotein YmbA